MVLGVRGKGYIYNLIIKVSIGKDWLRAGAQLGRSKPQHLPNTLLVLVMEFLPPTLTALILQHVGH